MKEPTDKERLDYVERHGFGLMCWNVDDPARWPNNGWTVSDHEKASLDLASGKTVRDAIDWCMSQYPDGKIPAKLRVEDE